MSANRPLLIPYLVLGAIAVSSLLLFVLAPHEPAWDGVRGLAANVAADILVVLLLAFLIDRILERNQQKERHRYKTIAITQLNRPLGIHFRLLFNMFKASVEKQPPKVYREVGDLFTDEYFPALCNLDFAKPAPIFPHLQWSEFVTRQAREFKDALTTTIDKYAMFLDSNTLDLLEQLVNSRLMWGLLHAEFVIGHTQERERNTGYYPYFSEGWRDDVTTYTQLFTKLVTLYNSHAPPEKRITMTPELWSEGTSPRIGQDRIPVAGPDIPVIGSTMKPYYGPSDDSRK